jgi:hypothetical protein
MNLLILIVPFVYALAEAPPIWQKSKDPVEDICSLALFRKIYFLTCDESLILIVTSDVEQMLQRPSHRRDNISQEEMSETHLSKR